MIQQFAALADIHGNLTALDAVIADVERRGIATVVLLGDLLSGPLQPRETADRLMSLGAIAIAGNHERQLLQYARDKMGASDGFAADAITPAQRAWLATLPPTYQLDHDVLLCHGTPTDDLTYLLETIVPTGVRPATHDEVAARVGACDARLILCGHSHQPRMRRLDDGRLVVNPGSVGLQAYEDDHVYPHTAETGSPHARYAIFTRGESGWLVDFIAVPYAWNDEARIAESNGRSDWAMALRTGRV
ncbi:metallophosphoesterase family protein [Roseiterribacter gracilis]|uniref:DNA methylase n=1 Tax=Roseiterribacter gracilis TaxID=2812848 RepID=A0A8S8X732_9PROT|nr:DNA methylase [Rhodospirillales bacterium TMPK1]